MVGASLEREQVMGCLLRTTRLGEPDDLVPDERFPFGAALDMSCTATAGAVNRATV